MNIFLSIDCGNTTMKTALYNQQGNELSVNLKTNDIIIPAPSYAERNMQEMKPNIHGMITTMESM